MKKLRIWYVSKRQKKEKVTEFGEWRKDSDATTYGHVTV